ncbi:hypothetical protein [Pandoraea fibrosis]|uniref:hypothetical protein n=1 Tax=Pandoraea fibrosis TaxID=1891094 RepID=UPI0012409FC9|nr:hypothetical protein [Pandoraea fibrosis]
MNNQPAILYRESNENIEIDVIAAPNWDNFDSLRLFLEQHFQAETTNQLDGPGSRICNLIIDGHSFKLVHDDAYGNYISTTAKGKSITRRIARELEVRLYL